MTSKWKNEHVLKSGLITWMDHMDGAAGWR